MALAMKIKQINNIAGLILDMDGVLWRDSEPIGDLPSIFDTIRSMGLKFILATNNATRTVEEYHKKIHKFGVILEAWQVITSAEATGIFIKRKYSDIKNAYVVGQPSLKDTLRSYGVNVVDETAKDVHVVVASLDYSLSYEKLKHATLLVRSGCEFIGTNSDVTFPTPEGLIPGSGTVIGALELATGKKAIMIGKPEPLLYQMALDRLALEPEAVLGIGDRLETDIAGAQAAGIHTALVLSGASTQDQADRYHPTPEIIAANLTELFTYTDQH
jgi:4-nitrophenyl phosphatase